MKTLELPRLTEIEAKRFMMKVDQNGPIPAHCASLGACWAWNGAKVNKWGHGVFPVWRTRKNFLAHRLSFAMNGGKFTKDRPVCLHHCDNPSCVNPKHLYAGNNKDNVRDMMDRGRNNPPMGSSHANAVLSAEQVLEIIEMYKSGDSAPVLAAKFGVHRNAIYGITTGRNWKHIGGERLLHGNKGKHNGAAIVTRSIAEEIRALYAQGELSQTEVAKRFGIHQTQVSKIVLGKAWG